MTSPRMAAKTEAAGLPRKGRPRLDGKPPITREQIIDTARSLFAKVGITATSIRVIAEQLDSHPASVFHHFPTKEHIISEVAAGIYGSQFDRIELICDLGLPADVTLFRLVRDDAFWAASGEGDQKRLFLLPELRSDQFPQVATLWERMVTIYADVLAAGIETGQFQTVPVRTTAEFITTVPTVSIISWTSERLGSARDLGRDAARFVLRSILAEPGRLEDVETRAMAIRVK